VSTTGQESKSPPVDLATVAAWRRRQEACSEVVISADDEQDSNGHSPPDHVHAADQDGEADPANGFHANSRVALNGATDSTERGFADSQQAGLTTMIALAKLEAQEVLPQAPPQAEGDAAVHPVSVVPRADAVAVVAAQAVPVIVHPPVSDQSGLPVSPVAPPPTQLPTTRAQTQREPRAIWARRILARLPALPIMSILCAQAVLSLRLMWSNTAFQDEALYLWAGRVEWQQWLHGVAPAQDLYNPFPAYFSGSPIIYPPLGAMANSIGGLAGARMLSLCFMLLATGLLYGTAYQLFGRSAALFAAAMFVAVGSTEFLGALATFDAMALMLLALATWLGVRAAKTRPSLQLALLITAACVLALADAAKYASFLFDPVVITVTALAIWRARGAKKAIVAVLIELGFLSVLLLIGIRFGGPAYWQGVTFTTLTRSAGTVPVVGVLYVSGMWIGAVAFLAVIGAVVASYGSCRTTTALAWVLASAVFLAPLEQARIHTVTSLFKHVDFGAWFGCIVAGYALISLARAVPAAKASAAVRVSVCVILLAAVSGVSLSGSHFARWPNSSKMVSELKPVIARTGCPCLLAAISVADYYLPGQTWEDQLTTVYYFHYWDNAEHLMLHGGPAYQQAIAAHYFRLVEIDPAENGAIYKPVTHALAATSGYKLVDVTPSNTANEPFEIWVYSPPPAHNPPQSHRPGRHRARRKSE
jgi:Dolichyl-phosphate-mannose-protein mannosyltransferase